MDTFAIANSASEMISEMEKQTSSFDIRGQVEESASKTGKHQPSSFAGVTLRE